MLNRAIAIDQKREITFYVLTGDGLSTTELEEAERACKKIPEVSIKSKYTVQTCMVNQILEEYFIASANDSVYRFGRYRGSRFGTN